MRKRLAVMAIAALGVVGVFSVPATAGAATFCYSAKVVVNGQELVNQAGCQNIPPA